MEKVDRRQGRARLAATLLGLTALTALAVAPARADTLVDAVTTAVSTFPSIEEAKANRRAQDFELKQQRGLYLPSLDIQGAGGPEWSKNQTVKTSKTMPRYESQATLSLLLFDGFGREAGIERSAARVDAAASRVLERSEAVAASAVETYLNVLRNLELVKLAEENVETHRDLMEKVRMRVNAGQSGAGDLQQARARFASAEESLVQSQKELQDSRTTYIQLINLAPDALEKVPAPQEALPSDMNEAIRLALDTSPTLAAAAADLDEANATHRQAQANYWPKFTLIGSTGADRNLDGVRGLNNEAYAMVQMTYNLYRGSIDVNHRMETAERAGQARAAVIRLERTVAKEVRDSWHAMDAAKKRADVLGQQVVADSQVVASYRQEFEIGQRDLLDLLDAENELFTSQTRATTAEYTYDYSIYRSLAAVGILNSTLGIEVPKEAAGGARKDAGVDPERVSPFVTRQPGYEKDLAAKTAAEAAPAAETAPAAEPAKP